MCELIKTIKAVVLSWKELNGEEQVLLEEAVKVRQNAQAPYSKYKVGCEALGTSAERRNCPHDHWRRIANAFRT